MQPLVRDGRMDKFYYEPSWEEMAAAVAALFAPQLLPPEAQALLDAFPTQPMDFFGSIKSRLVDDDVRRWLKEAGGAEVCCAEGLGIWKVGGSVDLGCTWAHRKCASHCSSVLRVLGSAELAGRAGSQACHLKQLSSSSLPGFWPRTDSQQARPPSAQRTPPSRPHAVFVGVRHALAWA